MITLSNYKDIDSTVIQIVSQYYDLIDSNKIDEAYDLLEENKDLLTPYYINANSFNKIEREIWELAKRLSSSQKIVISAIEPDSTYMNIGSEWLKEYE